MRVAVMADIHGNIHALEAVLADIERRSVDRVLCLGDLVGYGAFPNEVISVVRDRAILTVMGNYDEGVAFGLPACGCDFPTEEAMLAGERSLVWNQDVVTSESQAFLRDLPRQLSLNLAGKNCLFVHGSPRRINEYLFAETPDEVWEAVFAPPADADQGIVSAHEADILFCGHTHIPYHRSFGPHEIINAGSVGRPKHGYPQAVYALVTLDREVGTEFIKVPYDVEAAARAVLAAGLPEEFAEVLRKGRA